MNLFRNYSELIGKYAVFKNGGVSKIIRSEASNKYPGCVYLCFEGNRKYGINFTKTGSVLSMEDGKAKRSVFSIVDIKEQTP